MNDNIAHFRQAINNTGLIAPEDIQPERLIKFPGHEKAANNRAAWCYMFSDMRGGVFGDYSSGMESSWQADNATPYTEAERKANRQKFAAAKVQRESETARRHLSASMDAAQRLIKATHCTEHAYTTAKGVHCYGLKIDAAGALIVPMIDTEGKTHSLQTITADGEKRFLSGGRVKGCYHAIGKPAGMLIVCEGYATGASIHESTGHAVAVAFNAGNLEAVAVALRRKYPALKIIIAADDDHLTTGNPGMTKAKAAAHAVGGLVAAPSFPAGRCEKDTDFNDLHQLAGQEAVKECIAAAIPGTTDTVIESNVFSQLLLWTALKEIKTDLPLAPIFDAMTLLPRVLADFVRDEADRMPCSPDYIAAALIVCLGSVIGARCGIKPKRFDDWIITPNLFGGAVGDPSTKKSPALAAVIRFVDRLQAKEAERLASLMRIYEAETAAFEAHQAAVKVNMKKAASGKVDQLKMSAAIADLQSLQAPEEPKERRFKSNDSTVEKLGDLLVHNPQGMLVYRDELIGLLASWEKDGKEGDKAFYLEGWNGTGSFNIDRIGRGSLHIKNLCISVFGGIQPELLERYLAGISSSLDNDGRIQRFQVMVYPNPVAWEWRDRYPVKGAREAVRDMFERLAVFDPVQDGAAPSDDFVKLPHYCFDDAAQEIFVEWCTELHTVHIANEQDPLMQQHLGKFEKLFCSIALILHLAEGSIGPVTATSALRAAAWCEYLTGHARRIYGLVEAAKVSTARMLSRRLAQGKLEDGFTVRDVVRKQWAGLTTAMQVEGSLDILEENGHVQSLEALNSGGRPTVRYFINPQVRGVIT
jgi:phage/plasmid primase-like uncharacterized protein